MKNSIKIKSISKLIAFCMISFLLVYFSKYVFGKGNEIKVEKKICINGIDTNNLIRNKIGSFHIGNFQSKVNINTREIALKNIGDKPFWTYAICAKKNTNGYNFGYVDDSLDINAEIDGVLVYQGKLKNIFNDNNKYFKVIKKIQPNSESKMSIVISNRNYSINKIKEMDFDLYLLSTTKDSMDLENSGKRNRMYLGGYYSQEYNKYINEFWAECLQINGEIWFFYNKTSYNKGFEYIVLDINNENNKNLEGCRVLCFKKDNIISVDGIEEENIEVDWGNNIIKIKKSEFSKFGSGINVRMGSAETLTSKIQMTSYKYYSLTI
ncbi:MAG: hypothetical protein ACM3UU_06015 [Ignavibacteriales bacterium]